MRENSALTEFISQWVPKENILVKEPMNRHTSFKIGGEADLFVEVGSKEALSEILRYCVRCGQEYFILGKCLL